MELNTLWDGGGFVQSSPTPITSAETIWDGGLFAPEDSVPPPTPTLQLPQIIILS